MGLFNSIFAECPHCEAQIEWQSKAGPTECAHYTDLRAIPVEIAKDINGESQCCPECKNYVTIKFARYTDSIPMEVE